MKLVSPMFSSVIEIYDGDVFSLVLENQKLFRDYLTDLKKQTGGMDGKIVLSENNKILPLKKHIDILEGFAPFDINTKTLLDHIYSEMCRLAMSEEYFIKTSGFLSDAERYMDGLCFDIPVETEYKKLDIYSIIKAVQPVVANDNSNDIESIIDYMSLMLGFEPEKLFVFVNLRSYFPDRDIELFAKTVNLKQMQVMLLESSQHKKIEGIKQLIVDSDLCEI